jgi:hypothetical protein
MHKPFRLPFNGAWIKKGTSLLKNVVRIFNKFNEFQQVYEEVKRWVLPINHVADILNPEADKSSDSVRFHLQHLLQWVEQTYTEEQDNPMVANLTSYTKGFWKGLFTCYDYPHVPRTNSLLMRYPSLCAIVGHARGQWPKGQGEGRASDRGISRLLPARPNLSQPISTRAHARFALL